MSDNPFGMSFDELIQQINSGKAVPVAEPPKTETSGAAVWTPGGGGDEHAPEEKKASVETAMNAPTENAPDNGVSFEALMAQATANGASAEVKEPPKQMEEPEDETESYVVDLEGSIDTSEDAEEPVEEVSEASIAPMEESSEETAESISEEPKDETVETKTEASEPVSEESSNETTEPISEEPVNPSDAVVETVKEVLEKPAKPKRSRKKAKVSKPEEIEDISEETNAIALEDLFTPDEVEQFRVTLRSFVRKELKLAMTAALKELQKSFD